VSEQEAIELQAIWPATEKARRQDMERQSHAAAWHTDVVITGPPTHGVGGQTSNGRWRLSSSSVALHGGPAGDFTLAGQAVTSCRLLSHYNSMVTLHGGPVVLRPVRATACLPTFVLRRHSHDHLITSELATR